MKMGKLIFIASAGHSGSTLLDILTGTIPGIFSTGEVVHLPWQLYRHEKSKQGRCSCSSPFDECEVWAKIIKRLSQKVGYEIYDDPFNFRMSIINDQRYDKLGRLDNKIVRQIVKFGLVHNSDILNRYFYRKLLGPIKNNWLLFDTIKEVTGNQYIVDSSKDYIRMKFLYDFRPDDFYLIHLKRGLYGVACSDKKLGKSPFMAAKGAHRLNKTIETICRQNKGIKLLSMNYEDLCRDPNAERKRIADFLNLENPGSDLQIDTTAKHLVAGNGMRHKGKIQIVFDEEWRRKLTSNEISKIKRLMDI